MRPSVLRCRTLAPYVPLRAECSESVPALEYYVGHVEEQLSVVNRKESYTWQKEEDSQAAVCRET